MNNNIITQLEEISRTLKEVPADEERQTPSILEEIFLNITTYEFRRSAYIPPYRAAYMRAHSSIGGL